MNKEKIDRHQAEFYKKWLESAETKLLISMVSPTEPPEVLQTLLKAAYDNGFGSGVACVMISFLEEVILKDKK